MFAGILGGGASRELGPQAGIYRIGAPKSCLLPLRHDRATPRRRRLGDGVESTIGGWYPAPDRSGQGLSSPRRSLAGPFLDAAPRKALAP